ncbi:MAG: helix-turn-helix transcriptional regulator [Acidobacteriota bacterium]|nr:MAG: helix-turn-helix transcriptional regulator [Acidobacteriota bacterium]
MQGDFRVGDWLVRPDVNELNRNGEKKSIEPKVMDVLIYLSEHAGEVLSKERLIQAVWPDTFVTDDALKYAIVSLRKVLGDNASDPRFIRNIPKRGYQMVAEVHYPRKERIEQSSWFSPDEESPQNTKEEVRPYPGLISFSAQQARFFFGREIEVEILWEKIQRTSQLGVIGATGSGKSSFIQAGLVPAVPEGWAVVVATPGTKPLAGLALALFDVLAEDQEAQKRLLGIEDPEAAIEVVSHWRRKRQEALIAIDQFEELFTLNPPEVQRGFADLLGRLIQEAGVRVLLSMRDDFLMHLHGLDALKSVFDALTPISPPTGTALRKALVNPAALCGFHFEDEALVDQILGEVGSDRGALPLFAFTAARLWDCRDRNRKLLTRSAYEIIGGVSGSLARHAEFTLEEIEEKPIPLVRELFRNLVTAEGTRLIQER